MTIPEKCPNSVQLQALLLGQMDDDQAGRLEEHVSTCAACGSSMETLVAEDSFVDSVRQAAQRHGDSEEAVVRSLEDRVRTLTSLSLTVGTEEVDLRFLEPAQQPDEMGRLGSYRILRVLGTGGMGVVFEAEDLHLQRRVALKTMKPMLAVNRTARQRFLREAQVAASIDHDHVVTIHQVGEAVGVPFLAMQFLKGESLEQRLRREETFPEQDVRRISREIALGLQAASQHNLIHRDIKPANIWLEEETDRVKLLDFGLARSVDSDQQLSQQGVILGTPGYMSPEQAQGKEVDQRSDLFSLGCVMYRMGTGRPPFEADTLIATLRAVVEDETLSPQCTNPRLSKALSDLTLTLLEKNREARPNSAQQVVDALDAIEQQPSDPASPRAKPSRRFALVAVLVLCLLGPLAWLFGPTVIRFATNKGQIVVKTDDPSIEVMVKQGKTLIFDKTKNRTLTLTAGDYDIEVHDSDGLLFRTKQFAIERGGRKILDVQYELAQQKPEPNPDPKFVPLEPDKDHPFVVVRGTKAFPYKHFNEVLAVLKKGDRVEVFGNGPFRLQQMKLPRKGLDLRAGPGYRPLFVYVSPQPNNGTARPMLECSDAPLRLEGCDFEFVHSSGYGLFRGGENQPWEFRNCRFRSSDPSSIKGCRLMDYFGPKLTIADCFLLGSWNHPIALDFPAQVQIENNVIAPVKLIRSLLVLGAGGQTITLKNNTIVGGHLLNTRGTMPTEVIAEGNFFQIHEPFGFAVLGKNTIRWTGRDNLYAGCRQLVRDADRNEIGRGLKALLKLENVSETDVTETPSIHHFPWDFSQTQPATEAMRTLQDRVAKLRTQHGLPILGPDWNLVGPGDAYVRALSASGKPIEKSALRPDGLAGGPFVLVRKNVAISGHISLQKAVDQAEDGDVLEIRSDGPFPGARIHDKRLTIRSAPGYRPVIQGNGQRAFSIGGTTQLSLEGIHLTASDIQRYGQDARLVRLVNCSFDGGVSEMGNPIYPGATHRYLDGLSPGTGSTSVEVRNCFFPGYVSVHCEKGERVLVQNSVVGAFSQHFAEEGERQLVLDRSILWNPSGTMNPAWYGGKGTLSVTSNHTIFETGVGDHLSPLAIAQARLVTKWTGSGNLYRIGFRRWASLDGDNVIIGLSAWQKHWQSDADSAEGTPLAYDPQQWRLLPTSSGYKGGPGKDVGADITRIGTTRAKTKE